MVNIFVNIGFNIFLVLCPKWIHEQGFKELTDLVYAPKIGIGYVFISTVCGIVTLLFLVLNSGLPD